MKRTRNTAQRSPALAALILSVLALALAAAALLLVLRRTGAPAGAPAPETEGPADTADAGHGLFSWHSEVLDAEARETLLRLMREQGLTELYQYISHDTSTDLLRELSESCRENGVRLYLLVGNAEWATDKNARELRKEIRRAALLGCAGVMADIEPASTELWQKDRDAAMTIMTEGYVRAEEAAREEGIELIACLPWYYDDYGYEHELKTLVADGCDALAIMNYSRDDEIGQIGTEAEICRRSGKRLICIYELQPVGEHNLKEINTYNSLGLSALWESWEKICAAYPEQKLYAALHEYRALLELSAD